MPHRENSYNRQDTSRNETESSNDSDNENSDSNNNDDNNDQEEEEQEEELTLPVLPPDVYWTLFMLRMNNNIQLLPVPPIRMMNNNLLTENMTPEERSRSAIDQALAIIHDGDDAGNTRRTNTRRSHHRRNFPPRQ